MKRWIVLTLFLAPLLASAASFWDGNAAVQRGDSSFDSGLFAVSNSFAPGAEILVENLDTGKKTSVIVSQRMSEQSDILVLLSPKAAEALGIAQDDIARVRVTMAARLPSEPTATPAELTQSQDPDINPAAGISPAEGVESGQPGAEFAGEEVAASPETPPKAETPAETASSTTTEPAGEEIATQPSPEVESALLVDAAERTPQKQLFLPPREDEKFVYHKPQEAPPEAETQIAEATTTAEPEIQAPAEPTEQPETPPIEEGVASPLATVAPEEPLLSEAPFPAESKLETAEAPSIAEAKPQPFEAQSALAAPELLPAETRTETAETLSIEESKALPSEEQAALAAPELLPAETRTETAETLSIEEAKSPPSEAQAVLAVPEPLPAEQKAAAPVPIKTDVSETAPAPEAAGTPEHLALTFPEAPAPQPAAVPEKPAETVRETKVEKKTVTGGAPGKTIRTVTTTPRSGKGETWYLQLGAYSTEKVANDLAARFSATYPVLVLAPAASAKRIYKVLVGPLNKAESGTLLSWFRYRGFPDAFLKRPE